MRHSSFTIFSIFIFCSIGYAQEDRVIKVSDIENSINIDSVLRVYFDRTDSPSFKETPLTSYLQVINYRWLWINQKEYVSYFYVAVHNNTSSQYRGIIYAGPEGAMQVALVQPNGKIIDKWTPNLYSGVALSNKNYFSFAIPPDSTYHIAIRTIKQRVYHRTQVWLISNSFLKTFFRDYSSRFLDFSSLFYVTGGMLLMMLLYIAAQFFLIRTPEYGYYACYILFMLGFVIVRSLDAFEINSITSWGRWYDFVNNQMQVLAYCMYFPFLSHFLRTRQSDPSLDRLFRITVFALIGYVIADALLVLKDAFEIHFWVWNGVRFLLISLVFYIAYRVWKIDQPYARYPIYGGLIFVLFALFSLVINIDSSIVSGLPMPFNYGLFYYLLGVAMELIFFSLGLAHKRRKDAIEKVEAQEALKLEVERQQVRHLNALSEVQEQERSRFAKDLHDGLGGMLWGVKLSLSNMKGNMVMDSDHVQVFERSLDMLDNSIHELRRVAHNLMPEALVKFGLAAALKDFCDFINSSKVINVIFQQVGNERRLDMSVEVVLYRVANELVNNALRHSSASEIIIQLNYDDHSLTLTVEDNGKGFDKSILDKTTGAGWPNIKSRIAYLKGTLDVVTSSGNGTAINIAIPI